MTRRRRVSRFRLESPSIDPGVPNSNGPAVFRLREFTPGGGAKILTLVLDDYDLENFTDSICGVLTKRLKALEARISAVQHAANKIGKEES